MLVEHLFDLHDHARGELEGTGQFIEERLLGVVLLIDDQVRDDVGGDGIGGLFGDGGDAVDIARCFEFASQPSSSRLGSWSRVALVSICSSSVGSISPSAFAAAIIALRRTKARTSLGTSDWVGACDSLLVVLLARVGLCKVRVTIESKC